ncbi:MAG: DNA mismatch endonuclease Vsr [Mesorhizobium sp.]|uniref:very short patch repair endonuclease n=1 Tax=Mesorhizobium sp. TaxID=1871066 RepID=UPI000FE93307|nr:very short patch repair endonuclease [Mesorhizobium sp.]RWO32348.1 MAG: DNA mismatch endonuclease Vsr [Mesorhizobium sp.]
MTPEQRSYTMSRIRSTDTAPEMMIRCALHARGLRFRLHRRDLPGRPDLYFPASRTAVFIHGCFWHSHSCRLFRQPASRTEYWAPKLASNRERDRYSRAALEGAGIRVITVWECALRGRSRRPIDAVADELAELICNHSREIAEIRGSDQAASVA